jgi:hypothetical protein
MPSIIPAQRRGAASQSRLMLILLGALVIDGRAHRLIDINVSCPVSMLPLLALRNPQLYFSKAGPT